MDNQLFREDLKKYDLLQLENWIRRCRAFIKKDDFKDSNTFFEADYKKAVLDFVEQWQKHHRDNEELYKKDDFQKAILANGTLLDRIILVMKNGKKERKIDITEKLYNLFLKDEDVGIFQNLMDKYADKRLDKIDDYFELIKDIFEPETDDHKIKIVELIRLKAKYEIFTLLTVVEDKSIFKIDNVDELIEALISAEYEEFPDEFELADGEISFLDSLSGSEITRQVFYDFEEDAYSEEVSNKSFQKKFFINIGFHLSLKLDFFEMLLNLFGYTIEKSRVGRDRLISDFLYIGIDKEYLDISIEANNLRPLSPRVAGYQKRDINYINKFLGKTDYTIEDVQKFRTTLLFTITKLKSFIRRKEESIRLRVDKMDKLEISLKTEEGILTIIEGELADFEIEHPKTVQQYRDEISKKRGDIYKLKNTLIISASEEEENKKEIRKLIKESKDLIDEKNTNIPKNLVLARNTRNQSKKIESIKKRIKKTKDKILEIENAKYKSFDIFKEHIEDYNNLTLSEMKDLSIKFEALYNKEYTG